MITGATDGIGKAIAHELASKGLSVVLISRTQSKLDAVQTEIKTKYPSVEVATIAIDYGCFDDAAKEKVAEFVKSNNVGILINNVGASYKFARPWHELDAAKVTELNELNVSSTVWMTHLLLPSMLGKKSGAIVNMSSAAGRQATPLLAQYSAAKGYVQNLSSSLAYEVKGKGVDVQVQTPLYVTTKLASLRKTSLFVVSEKTYAKACCRWIGYDAVCSPYWSHALQLWAIRNLPEALMLKIVDSMHQDIYRRGKKKEQKKLAESGQPKKTQ